mgnify:CR=1 FL=1
MKNIKTNVWLITIFAGIAGGTIPAFSKIALETINSATFTMLRYIITVVSLVLFAVIIKQKIDYKKVIKVFPVSVLAAVNAICFAIGIQYVSAASVQLIYTIVPILVVLFSWVIFHQKTNLSIFFGVLLGFSGVIIVALAPVISKGGTLSFNLFGTSMIFLGAVSFALFSVLSKGAQQKATPNEILMGTAFATLVSQFVLLLVTNTSFNVSNISFSSLGATLVVGVIGTALFYWVYQYTVKISTPLLASVILYVMPFFGALWAYIVLGELILPIAIIGGILAIIGAAQVNGVWRQLYSYFTNRK